MAFFVAMAIVPCVSQTQRMRCVYLLALLLMVGCATRPVQPDLARLYAMQTGAAKPPPLIVVHGVLGGRLFDPATGEEVWPGPLRRVVFNDYDDLRLEIDDNTWRPAPTPLQVSGITDRAAGREFYARILDTLENVGGYLRSQPGTAAQRGDKRLYVYAYDWRQDNIESVRGLDALIETIREDYGDPDLRVDIVAHSMGGLITRYFIRYGTDDVLDDNQFPVMYEGDHKVRQVILLGTPNLGSIASLDILLNGHKVGLGRIKPEVLATFPSAYQLLPHPLRDWLVQTDGQPDLTFTDSDGVQRESDVFDVRWWRHHQLSIFSPAARARILARYSTAQEGEAAFERLARYFAINLERGRRFSWSLTVPAPHIEQRYIVFGGSCSLTPARILLEEVDGISYVRFRPRQVAGREPGVDYANLLLEPGDGTVTKSSLLARQILDPTVRRHKYSFFPLDYAIFLCEDHTTLTENPSFQDNLLNALLSAD